ncbi:MAG: O-methyltransferase [Chitinophagaceae bacterium]|nr:O-methyltransferase [Chitinophagaceae bacterium]MBK8788017.1 O-methyltransferase [Chitinophagaceae bacterium]
MELVNTKAEQYAKNNTSALDAVLDEIEIYTLANHPHAHMLSGHVQGKVLEFFSKMIAPERILEIGTFTGFSGLCLAKGLTNDGKLVTLELREDDAAIAKNYFVKAGMEAKIDLHVGDALEIIPTLQENWDLVFIDADKVNYINYYELTLPSVKSGGWILADNVLFHGEVLEENVKGKNAKAIHAFNEHVANDDRVEQAMLTIRDGLLLIQKK